MPVIVAFISQKGGVGKSTLARGLGAATAHAGLRVRIADLDVQQLTIKHWENKRRLNLVEPNIDVRAYDSFTATLNEAHDVELLIIDAPGRADRTTLAIARSADFIVQPTGPSLDDLYPGVLLFHSLVAAGIAQERLVFALSRTEKSDEEDEARRYIQEAGYDVLPGAIPERVGYRDAQNRGRAITESSRKELKQRADALMLELMSRVASALRAVNARGGTRGRPRNRKTT